MKKKIIFIISITIILFIGLYIYQDIFVLPRLTIEKLSIVNCEINENSLESISNDYDIVQNDIEELKQNISNLKKVRISCTCDNKSFLKKIEDAKFIFKNDEYLPNIIVGAHPATGFLTPVNIKPNKITNIGITVLINPRNYSDEEIMKILKNVKIIMISKNNGNIKVESNPVSLVVGASS